MSTPNLAILAPADAGKAILTERLLFAAGIIDEIGSGPAGDKVGCVRMFSGTVRVRDRLRLGGRPNRNGSERHGAAKVTAVSVVDRGGAVPRDAVTAGR